MTLRISAPVCFTSLLIFANALFACGSKAPFAIAQAPASAEIIRQINTGSNQHEIVGGTQLSANNPGNSSAVALQLVGSNKDPKSNKLQVALCTGTLIAPNLVVTAAHCMATMKPVAVIFGHNLRDPKSRTARKVVEFLAAPKGSGEYPSYDIGWVRFEGPAPQGYAPAKILLNPKRLVGNPEAVLVGYGTTADEAEDSGIKRTTVTRVGKYVNDAEHKSALIMGPTPGHGACHGDSGGPAYVSNGKEWLLIGATNGVSSEINKNLSCRTGAVWYSFVGDYVPWIQKTSGEQLLVVR